LALWETKTVNEVAEELGMSRQTVYNLVKRLREAGITVPAKTRAGYLSKLINEIKENV
jgi:biotin operon repressor